MEANKKILYSHCPLLFLKLNKKLSGLQKTILQFLKNGFLLIVEQLYYCTFFRRLKRSAQDNDPNTRFFLNNPNLNAGSNNVQNEVKILIKF